MVDPYRMVAVNLLASSLLLLGAIFYIYVYPKKKINLFVMLLLISVLPILSLLRKGDYESGDFNIHIYRVMAFYDSLKEGILMPSWAAELNATYGNPLFIFNYPLPYYGVSFFHLLGISFIGSMKIYLGLTMYLSGIFMYLWIKQLINNKLAAFASAIFYVFSPYHLIDVHFRATLGESTIFLLLPLLFLFITQYFKEKKLRFLVLIGLFTGLLFLAHPLLAGVFFGIEILFILFLAFRKKEFKTMIFDIIALINGAVATTYVWASFFIYSPYVFKLPTTLNSGIGFYPFEQFFYSRWRYGLLFQGPHGELALIIGYTQILVIIASTILIFSKKNPLNTRTHYIFWISLFFLVMFMVNPASTFIWKYIPNIENMLNLYGRLLLAASFCTSVIAGYFILALLKLKIKKIYIYLLLIITIGTTILNWGHRRVIPEINDSVLRKNVWKSTVTEGITSYFLNSKWADINNFWFSELPKQHLEIIQGKATVKELKRTSLKHTYILNAQTPVIIKENTLYFPGWSLKRNGDNVDIYLGKRGVINARLPEGLQHVELIYDDILIYKIAKLISVTIFLSLLSILVVERISSRTVKK